MYFNDKKITADVFSGTVTCPITSPKLTAPVYDDTSLVPGSDGVLTLEQFSINDNTFAGCGFRDY